MRIALLFTIRAYRRLISPLFGKSCRYEPTCSHYAQEAIETHGARRGSWLAIRRLGRCRPGGGHGLDPVPPRRSDEADHSHGPGQANVSRET